MCAIQFINKKLRKTVRTLCHEFKHAESPGAALIESLSPLIGKALQNGKARMTYVRVYTTNTRYHAETGDEGIIKTKMKVKK